MTTHLEQMAAALRGISACATDCDCCRMHVAVANNALKLPLCAHGRTICMVCKHAPAVVPGGTGNEVVSVWAPDAADHTYVALPCGCLDRCTGICKDPPYGVPATDAVMHVSV